MYLPSGEYCVFLRQEILKPDMKKEDWPRTHMFASQDLRTGEVKWIPIFYPPIFKEEYDNIAGGYGFSYEYNYKESRLVCGFFGYDSLMVHVYRHLLADVASDGRAPDVRVARLCAYPALCGNRQSASAPVCDRPR